MNPSATQYEKGGDRSGIAGIPDAGLGAPYTSNHAGGEYLVMDDPFSKA